jgi:hypothetical protein
MIRVHLPFHDICICEICGQFLNGEGIKTHPQFLPPSPDIQIGDRVLLHSNALVKCVETKTWFWFVRTHRTKERFVEMSERPREYTVTGLHYSQRGERAYENRRSTTLPLHTLLVTLRGSGSAPACTVIGDLTFEEFSLWRRGNREELEAAGLVEPEPVTVMA